MRFLLIINPVAGSRRKRKRVFELVRELRRRGATGIVRWTEAPGHARELARLKRDVDAIAAVGGDGTVREVASGLLDAGMPVPMGIVPFGSGNDFARALGLPATPAGIADVLMAMNERRIDYGSVEWQSEDDDGTGIFVNALGCGFDGFVAAEVARANIRGRARYMPAIFRSLLKWSSPRVRVDCASDHGIVEWEDEMLLCTAGNGTSTGGGFLLTPRASPADGLLDVCVARGMSIGRIFQVMGKAIRGRHLGLPEVTYLQSEYLVATSSAPLPLHLDGEVVSSRVIRLEARIVPGGLRVLTGQAVRKTDYTANR